MSAVIDMTGQRVGQLTVIRRAPGDGGFAYWLCACICGSECTYRGNTLRFGNVVSCGCFKAQITRARSTRHGHTVGRVQSAEYAAWANMLARTSATHGDNARIYRDRGIGVCPEWRASFEAFHAHVGSRPARGMSIDRIDNNRGYEPDNVRWATASQQRLNQRPRSEWAEAA